MMGGIRAAALGGAVSALTLALGGCGTVVPNIQEFPDTTGSAVLVNAITTSVSCELRNSVADVVANEKLAAASWGRGRKPATTWFETWGVQVSLNLVTEERTSVNVTGNWIDPLVAPSVFTLGSGIGGSVGAVRTNKINYFFTVEELVALPWCEPGRTNGVPAGSLLITSDLKLREWLMGHMTSVLTGATTIPATGNATSKNAVTHQIKFEVLTNGQVSPSWKIAEAVVNPASPFFSTSRNRVHELILVFGPIDKATNYLAAPAAGTFLAAEIQGARDRPTF